MADIVRFLFSIGGMSCILLIGCAWAFARRRSAAPLRFIAAVVLVYSLLSVYPVSHVAAAWLARPYHPLTASDVPAGKNIIVLLGSGSFTAHDWDENRVSMNDPVGADRVIEAVRIYRLIHPDLVISSGGSVRTMEKQAPGGVVMKDLMVRLGVPESRIVTETKSRTTHDEAVIVKGMLEPLHPDHVVLVTSDMHMRRSMGTFRAAGIEAIPGIARSPRPGMAWNLSILPSRTGVDEAHDVAHEVGGIAYYWLRGWFR